MQVPTNMMNGNMNNMMNFVNMVRNGNPQQVVMNMLQQRSGNPMVSNIINLVQSGNTQEIENIARNMARERGIDFDSEFNSFRQMFGL